MGYTHYWEFKGKVAPSEIENGKEKWELVTSKVKEALKYVKGKGIRIGNWDGTKEIPTITKNIISFNGMGEDAHETFCIPFKEKGWRFCKTARKPYDLLVCLTLLAFKDVYGDDFEYTSDGWTREERPDNPEKEWQKAYDAWEEINAA